MRMSLVLVAVMVSLTANVRPSWAAGFGGLPFSVEGEARLAALYVPPGYDASRTWPLIVYLHGGGGKGENSEDEIGAWIARQQIARAIREHPERFPALVLMPRCPEGKIWTPIPRDPVQSEWRLRRHGREPAPNAEAHVTAAIDAVIGTYSVDQARISIIGHSMGGEGSTRYASLHADRIAAVAPSAGSAVIVLGDAAALARMGVWIFQGETDPISSAVLAKRMVAAIREAGGEVRYTEYEGVGHATARLAYGDPEVVAWLLEQRRRKE